MFEREIQRAKELLTQRMAGASQYVYWDDIRRRADIAVFYRNFFGAESQWWIFDQQMQRAANPRFDTTNPALSGLFSELDHVLMESARYDHQDLNAAIDLAVKTRFNYILRPRTTLKWFVYRGEPTKTLREVMLRMDYFLEYDYMLDGVRNWISTKQQEKSGAEANGGNGAFTGTATQSPTDRTDTRLQDNLTKPDSVRPFTVDTSLVSVVEFDRVLQTVDNDVILEYSPEEFTDLLTPMFEMFDEIHAGDRALQQYRGKVPTPALIIFLDDKGIYRIAQELEELMKTRSLRYVGQREFLHVLNDIVAKLELAIANDELPKPAPIEDTTTLPLNFAPQFPAHEEPILKADDTIGELAIGTAIRTKRTVASAEAHLASTPSPVSESTQAETTQQATIPSEQSSFKVTEKAIEQDHTETSDIAQSAHENSPATILTNEELPEKLPEKSPENSLHQPISTAPETPHKASNQASNQAPNTTTSVIDAEFEITEPLASSVPASGIPLEAQFDHPSFAMQAADLAEMFKSFDFAVDSATSGAQQSRTTESLTTESLTTESLTTESLTTESLTTESSASQPTSQSASAHEKSTSERTKSEAETSVSEPPRSSFFTRFGSIFGSPRQNEDRE